MRKTSFLLIFVLVFGLFSNLFVASAQGEPTLPSDNMGVYLVNIDTNSVVYQHNENQKMYPASLTKMMTAIVALENCDDLENTMATYQFYMQNTLYELAQGNASTGGIALNEELCINDLLYAILIQSACEASMMVADAIAGSQEAFVDMMNQKAQEIGAVNTHFSNTHGLFDEQNYTTPYDMYLIARYIYDHTNLLDYMSAITYTSKPTNMHENGLTWTTINYMMRSDTSYYYEPVKGMKTGTLEESGRCFVSTASKDGYNYICVVMGAPMSDENGNAYQDNLAFTTTKDLYEWAFSNFKIKTLIESGTNVEEIKVRQGKGKDFTMLMSADRFTALVRDEIDISSIQLVPEVPESLTAPIEKGQEVGKVKLMLAGEEIGSVPLVTTESIERSWFLAVLDGIKSIFSSFWFKFILIFLIIVLIMYIFIMVTRNRNRRRYKSVKRRKRI